MEIRTNMPGEVINYEVQCGQFVRAGTVVAFLEAMKTKFRIVAPVDGYVSGLLVECRQRLNAGTAIISIQELATDFLQDYVFAQREDYLSYLAMRNNESQFEVMDDCLVQSEQVVARLVPISQIRDIVMLVNKLSLEPERKMPSYGWRFELFKNKQGLLEYEFTKREWRRKGYEYVDVSFEVCSAFEREDAAPLISYFQAGGLLESIAVDVYYRYNRLFAKFRPAVYSIEAVPELEEFMKTYMPILYNDLLATVTYALLVEFDAQPYVDKIIAEHYRYD